MPTVRVVATDVDGTFQNNAHEVPEANKAAARRCTAAGVPVVLCTGKVPGPWSERMMSELQLGTYAIFYNGGLIVDKDGATVRGLPGQLFRLNALSASHSKLAWCGAFCMGAQCA